jgi:hypothetical protein
VSLTPPFASGQSSIASVFRDINHQATRVYNLLNEYADKTRAAIVLVHHTTKGSQSDKRVTDVGSGAGAQSRAADTHLVLREHEEEATVVAEAVVRSFPPVAPLVLRWEFPFWRPVADADPTKLATAGSRQQKIRDDAETVEDPNRIRRRGREAGNCVLEGNRSAYRLGHWLCTLPSMGADEDYCLASVAFIGDRRLELNRHGHLGVRVRLRVRIAGDVYSLSTS